MTENGGEISESGHKVDFTTKTGCENRKSGHKADFMPQTGGENGKSGHKNAKQLASVHHRANKRLQTK